MTGFLRKACWPLLACARVGHGPHWEVGVLNLVASPTLGAWLAGSRPFLGFDTPAEP